MTRESLDRRLDRIRSTRPSDGQLAQEAVELAADWLESARHGMRHDEKKQSAQLARMIEEPALKALTFALVDQVFRPPTPERSAERFRDLIDEYGVPEYL